MGYDKNGSPIIVHQLNSVVGVAEAETSLDFHAKFSCWCSQKKQNWVILSCLVCKWMSLITIWLGEVCSQLIFLAVDDLLYFVLPTNHLQVDERCLIPAYEITLGPSIFFYPDFNSIFFQIWIKLEKNPTLFKFCTDFILI